MHLVSHNTCEPGDYYRKRFRSLFLCLLLCLSIAVGAPFSFILGGISLSMEGSKVVGVRKDSLQIEVRPPGSRRPKSSWENNN